MTKQSAWKFGAITFMFLFVFVLIFSAVFYALNYDKFKGYTEADLTDAYQQGVTAGNSQNAENEAKLNALIQELENEKLYSQELKNKLEQEEIKNNQNTEEYKKLNAQYEESLAKIDELLIYINEDSKLEQSATMLITKINYISNNQVVELSSEREPKEINLFRKITLTIPFEPIKSHLEELGLYTELSKEYINISSNSIFTSNLNDTVAVYGNKNANINITLNPNEYGLFETYIELKIEVLTKPFTVIDWNSYSLSTGKTELKNGGGSLSDYFSNRTDVKTVNYLIEPKLKFKLVNNEFVIVEFNFYDYFENLLDSENTIYQTYSWHIYEVADETPYDNNTLNYNFEKIASMGNGVGAFVLKITNKNNGVWGENINIEHCFITIT